MHALALSTDSVVLSWMWIHGQAAKTAPWNSQHFVPSFHPHARLVIQMNVSDFTGNLWLDAFNESAAVVMGMEAQKLGEMKEKVSRTTIRGGQ